MRKYCFVFFNQDCSSSGLFLKEADKENDVSKAQCHIEDGGEKIKGKQDKRMNPRITTNADAVCWRRIKGGSEVLVLRRSRSMKENSLRVPQRFSYSVRNDLRKKGYDNLNQKKTDVNPTTIPDGNRKHDDDDIVEAEEDLNKIHVVKEESK